MQGSLFPEDRNCTLPRFSVAAGSGFLSNVQALQSMLLDQMVAELFKAFRDRDAAIGDWAT